MSSWAGTPSLAPWSWRRCCLGRSIARWIPASSASAPGGADDPAPGRRPAVPHLDHPACAVAFPAWRGRGDPSNRGFKALVNCAAPPRFAARRAAARRPVRPAPSSCRPLAGGHGEANADGVAASIAIEPATDLTPRDPADAPALAELLEASLLPSGSLRLAGRSRVDEWPTSRKAAGGWVARFSPRRGCWPRLGETALDLCATPAARRCIAARRARSLPSIVPARAAAHRPVWRAPASPPRWLRPAANAGMTPASSTPCCSITLYVHGHLPSQPRRAQTCAARYRQGSPVRDAALRTLPFTAYKPSSRFGLLRLLAGTREGARPGHASSLAFRRTSRPCPPRRAKAARGEESHAGRLAAPAAPPTGRRHARLLRRAVQARLVVSAPRTACKADPKPGHRF